MTMSEEFRSMTAGTLRILEARMAAVLGREADRMVEAVGEDAPGEVQGALMDMTGYLGIGRAAPEANRHGIPHGVEWDAGHALQLIRDLAYALDAAGDELGVERYAGITRRLLELTILAADAGARPGMKEFLDQLVRGELADPFPTDG